MHTPGRLSGILIPLFSLRSDTDFGIGDFGALPDLFAWMKEARQRLLMLLPLLPTAPGDPSPYATRSAVGLNPNFIDLSVLPEWQALGGEEALTEDERAGLRTVRGAKHIHYPTVFALKSRAFELAFAHFERGEDAARQQAFDAWQAAENGWLTDYALFCALSEEHRHLPWWEWPEPEHDRRPEALEAARARLSRRVRFHAWLQWIAASQWAEVRAVALKAELLLCGDEPFIVGQDSVDAWAHPELLRRDGRLGVPPDPFSADGQDWGLPYYDFKAMAADDFAWLRARSRAAARDYDLRRVDHAVGYFRQYVRDGQFPQGRFIPDDALIQNRLGEQLFRVLSEEAGIVAEDLGVIPAFVRETLISLQIPGYKVLRWEHATDSFWHDPARYPPVSVACTGTHDTEPVATWWKGLSTQQKTDVARCWQRSFAAHPPTESFSPGVHYALLHAALDSGSNLCVLPWQDVMGIEDRVNLPGSTGEGNWSWRMPQRSAHLLEDPDTARAAAQLAALTRDTRR